MLWQRRAELAERAGLSSADEIELVCPEVFALAEAWLSRTQDLAESELPRRELGPLIDVALGLEATEGWPARITPRTLEQLFAGTRLLEGLDLDPGRLPETIAPASFLRALRRVGAAFADATAPRHQPFALAHDLTGFGAASSARSSALLPVLPAFARHRLALGRDRARRHVRALGRALLVESRVLALKVLLRPARSPARAPWPKRSRRGSIARSAAGIVGVLPHAFLRLHVDDSQRFAGALRAPARHESPDE